VLDWASSTESLGSRTVIWSDVLAMRPAAILPLLTVLAHTILGCDDGFEIVVAVCIGCGASGGADNLDECHPCAAGTAGTNGSCGVCPPGTEPSAARCLPKVGASCSVPGMGAITCPDNVADCVFSLGPNVEISPGVWSQQGSCAPSPEAYCAEAAGTQALCLARKCTYMPASTRCAPCNERGGEFFSASGHECTDCPRGKAPDAPRAACVGCQIGTQSSAGDTCAACSPGAVPNSPRTGCLTCSAGTYADTTQHLCVECPQGKFARSEATVCELCEDGSAADSSGVGCSACALGRAGTGGSCYPCAAGYAPETLYGAKYCAQCALNGLAAYSDTTRCLTCPSGRGVFADRSGCETCAAGFASSDGAQCVGRSLAFWIHSALLHIEANGPCDKFVIIGPTLWYPGISRAKATRIAVHVLVFFNET
jgi:proprotein convertase subtilisin/kexin type 5